MSTETFDNEPSELSEQDKRDGNHDEREALMRHAARKAYRDYDLKSVSWTINADGAIMHHVQADGSRTELGRFPSSK
jgi:hypothetical protein